MITISTEYYRNLYRIQQDHNLPSLAVLLPSTENIYELDLNTRKITPPEFLSTHTEHDAEVLYFKCDRFFDYMDLSNTSIIIQYVNALGENRIYPVPFVDVATCSLENKMLIPWCVDGNVTAKAGTVQFSIRFYKIDVDGKFLIYNLNTLPAKSKVLEAFDFYEGDADDQARYVLDREEYYEILDRIAAVQSHVDLEWIVL